VIYQSPDKKQTLIWPNVSEAYAEKKQAVFIAHVPDSSGKLDLRLFAVESQGPAVDITNDVVTIWKKEMGREQERIGWYFIGFKASPDFVVVTYRIFSGPEATFTISISWQQIADLIKEIQKTGKKQKAWLGDKAWECDYYTR